MTSHDRSTASQIDPKVLDARYTAAVADIRASQQIEAGQSGALVYGALAYGEALDSRPLFGKLSHLAKLFCIAAVFAIPNLLVIHFLMK